MRGQADRFIRLYGQTVTLRRPGTPNTDVTVRAFIRGYVGRALDGTAILQGEREVRIASRSLDGTNWPVPPRKGDRIITTDHTLVVEDAETRAVGDGDVLHVLRAKG